ncbi:MAG: phage tail sheath subtilisin-like domain-containing protein [Myxococcota bacterium]
MASAPPVTVSYPGVYLQEVTNTAVNVTPASTSDAAFIDWFPQGPTDEAVQITSLQEFNSTFGGLNWNSPASYAIQQFFLNGGSVAWVVRIVPSSTTTPAAGRAAVAASLSFDFSQTSPPVVTSSPPGAPSVITFSANSEGTWGNSYGVQFTPTPASMAPAGVQDPFNLTIQQNVGTTAKPIWAVVESYYNVTLDPTSPNYIVNVVTQGSNFVVATAATGSVRSQAAKFSTPSAPVNPEALENGDDGQWGSSSANAAAAYAASVEAQVTTGSALLDGIAPNHFNIMCLPGVSLLSTNSQEAPLTAALQYCQDNQAFLIVDPSPPTNITQTIGNPSFFSTSSFVDDVSQMVDWAASWTNAENIAGATYYPWLLVPDPLNQNNPRLVPPSGTIAGIYAATDASRGVWKAPAGVDAVLGGILGLADATLTDTDSGTLNTLGINALRTFPIYGNVVWGTRTLAGADLLQSSFKYVDVRRLTDFIEQSLTQSLKWAVFEPNAAPLWATITSEVSAFMASLYTDGAFGGSTAAQAYQVLCDATTTTPTDIENGIVNVVVAFQPVLPAEFVVLQIQINSPTTATSP